MAKGTVTLKVSIRKVYGWDWDQCNTFKILVTIVHILSFPVTNTLPRVLVAQSCLIVCDPTDYSLPGSSVHEILQARILEWVAISFSRRSSWPRDWTQVSSTVGIVGRHFTSWTTGEVVSTNYRLNELEKEEQTKLKISGRKEIIKIRDKIERHWNQDLVFGNDK